MQTQDVDLFGNPVVTQPLEAQPNETKTKTKPTNRNVVRRPVTTDERLAIDQMKCVRFLPASWDKRFFNNYLCGATEISEKASAQLWRLFKRYRRQMQFDSKERLLAIAEEKAAVEFKRINSAAHEQNRIDQMKAEYLARQKHQPQGPA